MRDDMRRVIITRGRFFDPNCQPRKGRRKPLEELPTKRSMRRDYNESWGRKSLNDYLSPLRRYLAKQVGRPWDKVYSEICQKAGAKARLRFRHRQAAAPKLLLARQERRPPTHHSSLVAALLCRRA
jgi:hypothetical protein